jgi:hypothetical protein
MTKEQIELSKYNDLCARATLYPGKPYEEVKAILDYKYETIMYQVGLLAGKPAFKKPNN